VESEGKALTLLSFGGKTEELFMVLKVRENKTPTAIERQEADSKKQLAPFFALHGHAKSAKLAKTSLRNNLNKKFLVKF
jgi:hypothetical protein